MRTFRYVTVIVFLIMFAVDAYGERVYRLGVRAFSGKEASESMWKGTIDKLNYLQLGHFELVPVKGFKEMHLLVKNGELDFVLTQPAEYLELEKLYGIRRLLTLLNKQDGYYLNAFSSVIFVRADNNEINELVDVQSKTLAGINSKGFGGYLLGVRELVRVGLDPFKDYSVVFSGSQIITIKYVLSGVADVGVVRTGVLEELVSKGVFDWQDIKVLNVRDDGFPLIHSTILVPEWSLAVTRNVDDVKAAEVAVALLTDKSGYMSGESAKWTTPVSYKGIFDVVQTLSADERRDNSRLYIIIAVCGFIFTLGVFFLLSLSVCRK
ncbi:ABC-type phosphate/phosphonate transport system periplasmic component-like protein [Denitrovibrio acetiphilus DSM 12809]|uniref:ABC-type phosphate/phosphonate transport system periplasmic component-like protein n=1 Tax=Denitrovibrio acetiphilus (strain DSM 12809 / NBRC 114555 / N2460) TaxID=522772 RepID=D4H4H3_DENA2|nr:PhnD/SsuA/transferrin family substrate-binding protein [Denitrovibrio acetiphilus]ADD69302.1 ABC-type phosphate/phosphonate transport system periplasmic component-like protein [Denitrovibrio acetiphilus DSM 12809]